MDNEDQGFFEIFPWNKNFETGIGLIDEQHKQLVLILNRLAANLANLSTPVILNELFNELADYADYHFKTEESIWGSSFNNDEWFTKHLLTHGSFIDKVIEIKNNQDKKPLDDVIYEIVAFLSKWLAYHILDTDKRMALAVLALKSGSTLEEAKTLSAQGMSGAMETVISTVLTMYSGLSARTLELMREKNLRKQAEIALKKKLGELARFRKIAVERELKMIALKKEINAYCHAQGIDDKYKIVSQTSLDNASNCIKLVKDE